MVQTHTRTHVWVDDQLFSRSLGALRVSQFTQRHSDLKSRTKLSRPRSMTIYKVKTKAKDWAYEAEAKTGI